MSDKLSQILADLRRYIGDQLEVIDNSNSSSINILEARSLVKNILYHAESLLDTEKQDVMPDKPVSNRPRFERWAGQGLPKGWAENMGYKGDDVGDVVWPIVDNSASGPIDGFPRPEQMLCWCPSPEKQSEILRLLRQATSVETAIHQVVKDLRYYAVTARIQEPYTTERKCNSIADTLENLIIAPEQLLIRAEVYDASDRLISVGDVLNVQRAGLHTVYEIAGELVFCPYGKPELVRSYLRSDIIKIDK